MTISPNALYHVHCLDLMERIQSESATVIYLDPPWYPVEQSASRDDEIRKQHWLLLSQVVQQSSRVLSKRGNLFIHATPQITGTMRLILDQVFGKENFRNEYVWPAPRHLHAARATPSHEVIIHYSKSDDPVCNRQTRPLSESDTRRRYHRSDERGPYTLLDLTSPSARPSLQYEWQGVLPPPTRSWRYPRETMERLHQEGKIYWPAGGGPPKLKAYLQESDGIPLGTTWDDIPPLLPTSREYLGYSGQKPEALLKRLICRGSNSDDLVIDPFTGAGTALVVAHAEGRQWIGCDSSPEAYDVALRRIDQAFPLQSGKDFAVGDTDTVRAHPVAYDLYTTLIIGLDDLPPRVERFVLNQPIPVEETRYYEFKEVRSSKPVRKIVNDADEYAVAYLNSDGGRIFWGVRDRDRTTTGVRLPHSDRDRLRRSLMDKLYTTVPSIDPSQYRLVLHQVYDTDDRPVQDLTVVELAVPRPVLPGPYYTASGDDFVKTESGKKKLSDSEKADQLRRRQRTSPE